MRLAILIPTLDEARWLEPTLLDALEVADDVIVIDGGSSDSTRAVAAEHAHVVLQAGRGRGEQIFVGTREANRRGADVALVLHADTRLATGTRDAIEAALAAGHVGGAFEICFDSPRRRFRLGERFVNWRSRVLQVPLGDQAQFATLAAIDAAGGFPRSPILEDIQFIRRLRRVGSTALLRPPVITSTRRLERGTLGRILRNWSIWALYFLGASPERLVRLYRLER